MNKARVIWWVSLTCLVVTLVPVQCLNPISLRHHQQSALNDDDQATLTFDRSVSLLLPGQRRSQTDSFPSGRWKIRSIRSPHQLAPWNGIVASSSAATDTFPLPLYLRDPAFHTSHVECESGFTCVDYLECTADNMELPSNVPTQKQLITLGFKTCDNSGSRKVCCKDNKLPSEAAILFPSTTNKSVPREQEFQAHKKPAADYPTNNCPAGSYCVNYRSCSKGVFTEFVASVDLIGPSPEELAEFGLPCGPQKVCCRWTSQTPSSSSPTITTTVATYYRPNNVEDRDRDNAPPKDDQGSCPIGSICILYRLCANGIMTNFIAGFDSVEPSLEELQEFGKPCGSSGVEVCCKPRNPSPSTPPTPTAAASGAMRPGPQLSQGTTSNKKCPAATGHPLQPSKPSAESQPPTVTGPAATSWAPVMFPEECPANFICVPQKYCNQKKERHHSPLEQSCWLADRPDQIGCCLQAPYKEGQRELTGLFQGRY